MEKGLHMTFSIFLIIISILTVMRKSSPLYFQKKKNTTSHYQKDIINLGRLLHIIKWYVRITFSKKDVGLNQSLMEYSKMHYKYNFLYFIPWSYRMTPAKYSACLAWPAQSLQEASGNCRKPLVTCTYFRIYTDSWKIKNGLVILMHKQDVLRFMYNNFIYYGRLFSFFSKIMDHWETLAMSRNSQHIFSTPKKFHYYAIAKSTSS
jgi:ABC-type multidrug transport system fused ATPase/permease subunit